MSLGKSVRRALGRYEPVAIRLYRRRFINLDALAALIRDAAPEAERILEIGCGDGALATSVRGAMPSCKFLGIDPGVPRPGAFYEGAMEGIEFTKSTTSELLAEATPPFDLVIVCDVVHHVAEGERQQLLVDAAALTAPGGTVAVKEWERSRSLGYSPAYYADRWVSGDKTVRFMPRDELDALIDHAMPGWPTTCEARVPPRRANLLLTRRRPDVA